jgi:YVTN family beta-propeller protein
MKTVVACGLILGIVLGQAPVQAQEKAVSGYQIIRRDSLGGEGGWDFLTFDEQTNRLFISHATHVVVFDVASEKVIGDITNTNGVHGIALDREDGKGYTSNGRDSSVTVFDLKSLKVLGEIRVGQGPDDIFWDQSSKHVFTLNGRSNDATVIDPKTDSVIGTVKFNGRPEFAVTDGQGRFLIDLEDSSEVVVFDSKSLAVGPTWRLTPGEEPTGMAWDLEHHRLFVGCANSLMVVMQSDSGRVITTVPIGSGVDGLGFDPEQGLVFSSNGEGTLTVVRQDSPDAYSIVENVTTKKGARTMALDQKSHRIYTVTADFGPPPAPTADRPHPRPSVVPGSFVLLTIGK